MASLTVPYTQLDEGVERLLAQAGPHYVLFVADPDPATGVSWCPDCVRCGPAAKRVAADRGAALLEVLVGPRAVWKDPRHPLRGDPLRLGGVPDLMRWGPQGAGARMGTALEKAASPAEAVAAVAKFMIDNP
ncbi:thioredoxin-like protein Clot [Scenedesmus sp. PABB004]|nr:thioredoxin-like protein Clot [Scenedesmus sp. PABB004]